MLTPPNFQSTICSRNSKGCCFPFFQFNSAITHSGRRHDKPSLKRRLPLVMVYLPQVYIPLCAIALHRYRDLSICDKAHPIFLWLDRIRLDCLERDHCLGSKALHTILAKSISRGSSVATSGLAASSGSY
jgi:hypothetical protein